MTLLRAGALLAVFVAPLAHAQDEDGWRWDPTKERKPVKGYRQVSDSEGTEKKNIVVRLGETVAGKEESDAKTVARYVHETLEVADGKVAKARVKVEKWSRTLAGRQADRCLEGQTIIVEGHGASMTWRCEDETRDLSDGAKEWIDQSVASRDADANEEAFKSVFPEKPIAPGDEWTRDPSRLARVLLGPDVVLDAEKSSAKGKLGEVKNEDGVRVGRFTLEVVLVSKGAGEGDTMRVELSATFDGSLEPQKKDSSTMTLTIKAKGRQKQQTEDGVALVDLDNVFTAKESERPADDAAPKK
jgi:hypothetical protein